jgi:mono/diheme cytochrome c family protein
MNKLSKFGLMASLFSFVACQAEYQSQQTPTNQTAAKVEPKEKSPRDIEEEKRKKQYKAGQILFLENCASCHNNDMKSVATASALGGITQRRSKDWLYKYVRNSEKMLAQKDQQALEIAKKNSFKMPSFAQLTDEEIDQIFIYVEKRHEKNNRTID